MQFQTTSGSTWSVSCFYTTYGSSWFVINKRCKHNFRIKLIRKLCLQTFRINLIRKLPYQHPWRRRRRRGTYLDNADARTQQHHRQHPQKTNEARDWKVTKKTHKKTQPSFFERKKKDAKVTNEGHEEATMARKKRKKQQKSWRRRN